MLRTSQSDLSGGRQMERKGLLWLLDEETVCPGGSDETFLDRLFSHYGDRGKIDFSNAFALILNLFAQKTVIRKIYFSYRSSNASKKSARKQSIRAATFVRNKSRALYCDRLAQSHARKSRRQECHYDTSRKHKVPYTADLFV